MAATPKFFDPKAGTFYENALKWFNRGRDKVHGRRLGNTCWKMYERDGVLHIASGHWYAKNKETLEDLESRDSVYLSINPDNTLLFTQDSKGVRKDAWSFTQLVRTITGYQVRSVRTNTEEYEIKTGYGKYHYFRGLVIDMGTLAVPNAREKPTYSTDKEKRKWWLKQIKTLRRDFKGKVLMGVAEKKKHYVGPVTFSDMVEVFESGVIPLKVFDRLARPAFYWSSTPDVHIQKGFDRALSQYTKSLRIHFGVLKEDK